jgi:hypothetical protein
LIVRRRRASVGLYIHSAAWAKQQEKEKERRRNHRTSEKRKWKTIETPDTRPRNLDPLSPLDHTFSNRPFVVGAVVGCVLDDRRAYDPHPDCVHSERCSHELLYDAIKLSVAFVRSLSFIWVSGVDISPSAVSSFVWVGVPSPKCLDCLFYIQAGGGPCGGV